MHVMRAVLAVALAAALAACGAGTQDGGVTLTLKHISDNEPAFSELIAQYKRVAPHVTVQASYAPVDDLQTSLRAQIGGGNAPDLFVVWPGNGSAMSVEQLAPTGVLADLSGQGWIGDVPANLRPLLGAGGRTYMYSSGVMVIGAIANRDVLAAAGVAEFPRTWSELLRACERVKAAGKACIALGNQTPWVTQLLPYAIAPSTAFAQEPDLAEQMRSGRRTFADSGWRTVFERYLDLMRRGAFNPSPNGTTLEQQQALVGRGEAAMAVQVMATTRSVRAAAADAADIAVFPFPAADDPDELKIPAGVSAGLGASAGSHHLDEAKRFIEWLAQPAQMALYARASGAIPLVGADAAPLSDVAEPFARFVAESRTVPFMDQQWPNAKVQPAHFAGIQDLTAGRIDVDGLLARLDAAYAQR